MARVLAQSGPGGLSRREYALVGLGLGGLVALYIWGAHHWLDPVDEGYFAYTSSRLLAGDLPYRDFATPYTPGFFYLNALLFKLFGMDLLAPRIALCLVRGGLLLLLYLMGRRIMSPAFAVIPLVIFVGQDPGPTLLEVHPAWDALLFALLAAWCATRYLERPAPRWLLGAGLAAGASFAFKQNSGLFVLLALWGLLLAEPLAAFSGPPPRWIAAACRLAPERISRALLLVLPAAYYLALLQAIGQVMRPYLDALTATLFLSPLLGSGGLMVVRGLAGRRGVQRSTASAELAALLWRLHLVSLGFALATLIWLVPLMAALGPGGTPLGAFLGGVDQNGYFYPLGALSREGLLLLVALALGPLALWRIGRPASPRRRVVEGSLAIGALVLIAALALVRARMRSRVPEFDPLWLGVDLTAHLVLYLPALAFWAAFGLLALRVVRGRAARFLRWYLLVGSFLLLQQYPRTDETHLLYAAPLLWVAGAYALSRLHRRLLAEAPALRTRPVGGAVAFCALLTLPLAAVWPSLDARLDEITGRDAGSLLPMERRFVTLGLPGASVHIGEGEAARLLPVVNYLKAHSRPGERIFVYPAAPLLYYLADRPNATRFNHILPGLLSADEQAEAISALERSPAVLIVWDAQHALEWETGNARRLTDYIWDSYQVEANIADYVIMARKGEASVTTPSE